MSQLRILRWPEVGSKTGLCKALIDRLEKKGEFPARFRILGGRAVGWRSDQVDAWIEARSTASGAPPPPSNLLPGPVAKRRAAEKRAHREVA